jgi:Na+-driven multidrug efflux pump
VRALRLDLTEMKQILLVGIPSGVQGALFAISNMIIQSSIIQVNNTLCDPNAAYQPIVKGSAAVANLEGFAYTAVNAVSHATISYVSQNLGAANYDRIVKIRNRAYVLDLFIAILASSALLLLRAPLLSLYGVHDSATDPLAKMAFDAAITRMMWGIAPYALLSFMEVGAGVLRGLGRSMTSTVICLITACAMRIVWINTVFRALPTLDVIFMIYPITWTLASIPLFWMAARILRHMQQTKIEV